MKKGQVKSILIFTLITLFLAMVGYALTVTLNSPNAEWSTDSSVDFNFTPDANVATLPWCAVYTNSTGSWVTAANYTDVPNGTHFVRGIGFSDSTQISWIWNVVCYNGTEEKTDSANNTFGVDSTSPSIVLDSPSNAEYLKSNAVDNLTFISTDASNPDSCVLYSNVTGSWVINHTFVGYTSGTQYHGNLSEVADGHYKWNVICNDSATNSAWGGTTNYTFIIDSVAPIDIKIILPLNNTVSDDTTPYIVWNQTTEINFDRYYIYASTSLSDLAGTATVIEQETSLTHNYTTMDTLETDKSYYLWVKAVDLAGNEKNVSDIFYYTTDSTTPSITLNSPTNGTYSNDNTPDFNVTVIDNNPDTCRLYLSNSTGGNIIVNITRAIVLNNTEFNMTPTTMIDGAYKFNVECNDSFGVKTNVSTSDLDVTIDTVNPADIRIVSTWHQTNGTDGTPNLIWNQTSDTNFDKYVAEARYVSNGSIVYQSNISNISIVSTEMNLEFDSIYNFSVTAYDLAENTFMSTNTTDTWYYSDSTCATLYAGWNLCGIIGTTARNLSVIGDETGASLVAAWNSSHQWQTCNVGVSSINCDVDVGITGTEIQHVWIYVSSQTLWENRTWEALDTSADYILSNITNGWNIVGGVFRDNIKFGVAGGLNDASKLADTNVSLFVKRWNINASSVPFVTKDGFDSIHNETLLEYGEALWIYYNGTGTSTFNVDGW